MADTLTDRLARALAALLADDTPRTRGNAWNVLHEYWPPSRLIRPVENVEPEPPLVRTGPGGSYVSDWPGERGD